MIFLLIILGIVFLYGLSLFIMAYSGRNLKIYLIVSILLILVFTIYFGFFAIPMLLSLLFSVLMIGIALFLRLIRYLQRRSIVNSKVIIPVQDHDLNLKFYEIGSIIDGKVTLTDLAAHYMLFKLFPTREKNSVDKELDALFEEMNGFHQYTNTLATGYFKTEGSSFEYNYVDATPKARSVIQTELVKKGYYNYDPFEIQWKALPVMLIMSPFFVIAILINQYLAFIIFIVILFQLIILMNADIFAENLRKTSQIVSPLLGHKMFLNTVEKYKITKDTETFRKVIPYFIAYGIRDDLVDEGLKFFGLINNNLDK